MTEPICNYCLFNKCTLKKGEEYYKTCEECRTNKKLKSYCEHGKIKAQCKECDGSAFCEHNKRKANCKQCGGSQICIHNKERLKCKECGGSQICIHNKHKTRCKECGGGSICIHNKIRSSCKECGGSQICIHNKHKTTCKKCGGGSICIHNKIRSRCKECGGSQICIHNRQRQHCKECGGSQICIHNKRKERCKLCNFKQYLVNLQRNQIYRCFKSSNNTKSKHSIEYLGCTIEEFIEHFNKKIDYFNKYMASDEIMTFDNIHIDHIKPVSVFNLDNEEEFLDCCHYTNLQPLLSKDNLEKHNRWSEDNEIYWQTNIKNNDQYSEIYMI